MLNFFLDYLDPVPVVVVSGKKIENKKVIELEYNSMETWANILDMGRNFFQNENPVGMLKAVRGIIHGGLTQMEAMGVYNTIESEKFE